MIELLTENLEEYNYIIFSKMRAKRKWSIKKKELVEDLRMAEGILGGLIIRYYGTEDSNPNAVPNLTAARLEVKRIKEELLKYVVKSDTKKL